MQGATHTERAPAGTKVTVFAVRLAVHVRVHHKVSELASSEAADA